VRLVVGLCAVLLLVGCTSGERATFSPNVDVGLLGDKPNIELSQRSARDTATPITGSVASVDRKAIIEPGTGEFVENATARPVEVDSGGRGVTLNFVNVDFQEFVRSVFDEVFKEPVVIDSSLKGNVTVRTPGPVSQAVARDLVRQAVQANGATMIQSGGATRIVSKTDQKTTRRLGDTYRIVPLRYIGADEAKAALATLNSSGVEITAGPSGQYLGIGGAPADLDNIEQVLSVLDVDQMKGMSFGLFPLREASATAVASELSQIFNRENDPRGFRGLPISRINAVLVLSPRPHLLAEAKKWISRLDRADHDERKIYVYPVQNRRATDVAKLLNIVLQSDRSQQQSGAAVNTVAPSLTPVASAPATSAGSVSRGRSFDGLSPNPADMGGSADAAAGGQSSPGSRGPRVSADASTNSIVATASPEEWRLIEAALRRLDIMAPQVLIEATIAEVTLNNSLKQGVRWYFEKGLHGIGLTDDNAGAVSSVFPGFNYSFGLPQARVILSALQQVTDVEIVSSPALTVLDNETAKLQVGDQVPIATRSSQSSVVPDAPIVNDIELKDTGVILSVTPRVNASGLVVLDITQEVSDVVPTTTSSLNSPTIRQRKVNSSIAVKSGGEIVLGGLIGASRNKANGGVPFIMDAPLIGGLFKSQANIESTKTELIVILRPTVMRSNQDIQTITQEIKRRMATGQNGP